jgi:hypothetical protein
VLWYYEPCIELFRLLSGGVDIYKSASADKRNAKMCLLSKEKKLPSLGSFEKYILFLDILV